jgi:hypothetical protein
VRLLDAREATEDVAAALVAFRCGKAAIEPRRIHLVPIVLDPGRLSSHAQHAIRSWRES